ncbi:MAG: hypothetical protein QM606_09495, partial [Leucobacter sp.]
MNEYTLLQTLREDVAEPTPAQLAPVFARLERAMAAEAARPAVHAEAGRAAAVRSAAGRVA